MLVCTFLYVQMSIHTCDFSNRSTRIGGNSSASRYSSSSPSSYGRRMVSESSKQDKYVCHLLVTNVVHRSEKHNWDDWTDLSHFFIDFSYRTHFFPWALKNSLHSQGTGWPPNMTQTPETLASPVDSHFFSNSSERQQKTTHIRDKSLILATNLMQFWRNQ